MAEPLTACVVGHGTIGALHAGILASMGADVGIVDPAPARSAAHLPRWDSIEELPARHTVGVWVVCTPTREHLRSISAILRRDPRARMLLEKPACRVAELDRLSALLRAHPRARAVVMDQYRYATALAALAELYRRHAPDEELRGLRVAFSKDRRPDNACGRFVDRDHGVFGYEWLHMLAVLRHFLPAAAFAGYLAGPLAPGSLRCAYDHDLFITAALERTTVARTSVELFSTVVGDAAEARVARPGWTRRFPSALGGRQRLVRLETDSSVFCAELEPIGRPGGGPVRRNLHRITVETVGRTSRTMLADSPLHNATRQLVADLRGRAEPRLDLLPLRRVATLVAQAGVANPAPATSPASAMTDVRTA